MNELKSLDEIRESIDRLDREIVRLISERGKCVKQAAKFKRNAEEVKAPKRVEEVIKKVRALAIDYGASPEIVEQVYRTMIGSFIDYEIEEHNKD